MDSYWVRHWTIDHRVAGSNPPETYFLNVELLVKSGVELEYWLWNFPSSELIEIECQQMKSNKKEITTHLNGSFAVPFTMTIKTIVISDQACFYGEWNALHVVFVSLSQVTNSVQFQSCQSRPIPSARRCCHWHRKNFQKSILDF